MRNTKIDVLSKNRHEVREQAHSMKSFTLIRTMTTAGHDRGAAVYEAILKKLTDGLQPTHIDLLDDSKSHQGIAVCQSHSRLF